jgi:aspartyl-tRNA synthetase
MCGTLRPEHKGQEVTLAGWVDVVRDLGSLLFVELRDREGNAQVVFREERDAALLKEAKTLRSENVVYVSGEVAPRSAKELQILSRAETPPFVIEDDTDVQEEHRLRYRYLDLRRPVLHRNLAVRHRMVLAARNYFNECGFLEIETPFLFRSTPEGARDYVVPSRLHRGTFYALPQSPQIMKQLLMVAGYDRYVQIVRCFRDEDLRAHRQPEFTQVDVEMSFVEPQDIFDVIEGVMKRMLAEAGKDFPASVPHLAWREAMDRCGIDAPDMRFGLEIADVTDEMKTTETPPLREAIEQEKHVARGLLVEDAKNLSRARIDSYQKLVQQFGATGMLWLKAGEENAFQGTGTKHLSEGAVQKLASKTGLRAGGAFLFLVAPFSVACESLGRLRLQIARDENLVPPKTERFAWITDFPAFAYDPEAKRYVSQHHPFTAPREEDLEYLESDPAKVLAQAYDLVWNGIEMGGGSIRNHRHDVQMRAFRALGFTEAEAQEKFSFLLDALRYGAPPHGGIALGLDRIVMTCLDEENIRNVIAFPKTGNAACLMSGTPAEISPAQLRELGLKITKPGKPDK